MTTFFPFLIVCHDCRALSDTFLSSQATFSVSESQGLVRISDAFNGTCHRTVEVVDTPAEDSRRQTRVARASPTRRCTSRLCRSPRSFPGAYPGRAGENNNKKSIEMKRGGEPFMYPFIIHRERERERDREFHVISVSEPMKRKATVSS